MKKYDDTKNIKSMGYWISTQKKNYIKEEQIMKEPQIRQQWEDFTNK